MIIILMMIMIIMMMMMMMMINLIYITKFDTNDILTALYIVIHYTHYSRRRNVTTSMGWIKNGHVRKNLTQNGDPNGNAQDEEVHTLQRIICTVQRIICTVQRIIYAYVNITIHTHVQVYNCA